MCAVGENKALVNREERVGYYTRACYVRDHKGFIGGEEVGRGFSQAFRLGLELITPLAFEVTLSPRSIFHPSGVSSDFGSHALRTLRGDINSRRVPFCRDLGFWGYPFNAYHSMW